MDAHDDLAVTRKTTARPDVSAVKRVYERIDADGPMAGVEQLLSFCHDDVEMRPYLARDAASLGRGEHELLRGHREIADFFRSAAEGGFHVEARTKEFDVTDDCVIVRGSIRVFRPDGSFAETKIRWNYHFRDGLVAEVSWEPRAGG